MKPLTKTTRWLLNKAVKVKVLQLLEEGYQGITERDMWEFLERFYWKKLPLKTVQELKVSISEVKANDYFDYQRLKAMTKHDFEELDYL